MTNKEVVLNFFQALDNNDFATAEKILGPHHEMYSSMTPEPANAEQHLAISKDFHKAFSEGRHKFIDVIESENKVVARGVWTGVHSGNFKGLPPTNRPVRLTFIIICEIEDGALRKQWLEMDGMSLMMQIGAIPEPAQA